MLKKIPSLLFSWTLVFLTSALTGQCYELVFAEEFNYTGLPDSSLWTYEQGAGGWGNNELQYYKSADPDNSWVENGALRITAIKENFGGSAYTSSRLITRDRYELTYGKIEARMKLPFGKGIWPAFWMLGANFTDIGWPASGEIDIMEMVGGGSGDRTSYGTAHWQDADGQHASHGGSISLETGRFADDFHLFAIEWDASSIRWYMDNQLFHSIDIRPSSLNAFHKPFFLILNVAVGGNWPGYPDATTVFPQSMEIDYIKVYKTNQSPQISGSNLAASREAGLLYTLPFSETWTYEWSVPDDAEIISGQGSSEIEVRWGCSDGSIECTVQGDCQEYKLSHPVSLQHKIWGPLFIEEGDTGLVFAVAEMDATSYSWHIPGDASILSGEGTNSVRVNWGNTFSPVSVDISNACGTQSLSYRTLRKGQYPYPDPFNRSSIPGLIEAVNYDFGGEGLAYHDRSNTNEGPGPRQEEGVDTEYHDNGQTNVGWIESGEWLEYSIAVAYPDLYDLELRVATNNASGGPFSIWVNGEERMSGIEVPATGGWSNFVNIKPGLIFLEERDTLIRLDFSTGGFNISRMTFTATNPSSLEWSEQEGDLFLYPNPADEYICLAGENLPEEYRIVDLSGSVNLSGKIRAGTMHRIDIQDLKPGIYLLFCNAMSGVNRVKKFVKIP